MAERPEPSRPRAVRPGMPLLAFASLLLYLALPGHPFSLVGGLPWAPLALGCVVVLASGLFAAWPLPDGNWWVRIALVALTLSVLKVSLALSAPRYGLEASYYANDQYRGLPESSTVAPRIPYTRVDRQLAFGTDDFPLFFFNDEERFNWIGQDRFERGKWLIWSARWSGYLNLAQDRQTTLALTASGPGELSLDGQPLLRVDADGRATDQRQIGLARGSHLLEVRYVRRRERS